LTLTFRDKIDGSVQVHTPATYCSLIFIIFSYKISILIVQEMAQRTWK